MHFPAALHIPSIFGAVLGVALGMEYWYTNRPLAVFLVVIFTGGGIWLGLWLSEKWVKGLRKDD